MLKSNVYGADQLALDALQSLTFERLLLCGNDQCADSFEASKSISFSDGGGYWDQHGDYRDSERDEITPFRERHACSLADVMSGVIPAHTLPIIAHNCA